MRQTFAAALLGVFAGTAAAQEAVDVRTAQVAPGVHVMHGAGGNIGVSVGPDGVFLVDDQYAVMTPKVAEALAKLTAEPPRFVLNTHWHGDHTGGNENLELK
jgi:glyoxylase-like metal-dependent hydrolase (beta-lactamase superfamily II)